MDFQAESVIDGMVFRKPDKSTPCGDARNSSLGMPQLHAGPHREFEEIEWHIEGQPGVTLGVLVGRTSRGLTVVADHQSGCSEGSVLIPSSRFPWRGWRRPVEIKRVVQLSDAIDLIAADYVAPQPVRLACNTDGLPVVP